VSEHDQNEFWTAMGESLAQHISTPVPFEEASPQACLEVIQHLLGYDITPSDLASLTPSELQVLANEFSDFFEVDPPSIPQLERAIADRLAG
jgi:hypothetical protein